MPGMVHHPVSAFGRLPATNALSAGRITVPAGSFQMGYSVSDDWCEDDEALPGGGRPAFSIDRNEMTVSGYRSWMAADVVAVTVLR